MIPKNKTADDAVTFSDALAAELTDAAYPIALQHARGESWIDLKLRLWRALAESIQNLGGIKR